MIVLPLQPATQKIIIASVKHRCSSNTRFNRTSLLSISQFFECVDSTPGLFKNMFRIRIFSFKNSVVPSSPYSGNYSSPEGDKILVFALEYRGQPLKKARVASVLLTSTTSAPVGTLTLKDNNRKEHEIRPPLSHKPHIHCSSWSSF